jgi:hypothetical protein
MKQRTGGFGRSTGEGERESEAFEASADPVLVRTHEGSLTHHPVQTNQEMGRQGPSVEGV